MPLSFQISSCHLETLTSINSGEAMCQKDCRFTMWICRVCLAPSSSRRFSAKSPSISTDSSEYLQNLEMHVHFLRRTSFHEGDCCYLKTFTMSLILLSIWSFSSSNLSICLIEYRTTAPNTPTLKRTKNPRMIILRPQSRTIARKYPRMRKGKSHCNNERIQFEIG